ESFSLVRVWYDLVSQNTTASDARVASVRPSPEKQTELARTGSSASGFSVATSQSFRPKSPFFAELYHATASTRLSGENATVKLGILRAPLALPSWLSQT